MKVSIIGYGRTGKSITKLLKEKGYDIFISDINSELNIDVDVSFEKGKHSDKILLSDMIVISPGVRTDLDIIKKAKDKGIPVYSEIEVSSWFIQGNVIAITGTNGKTTTGGMLKSILDVSEKKAFLAGNIYPGNPLSEIVSHTTLDSFTIIEVSSFQLENIEKFHPNIGIITNIGIDHLDRYGNQESYAAAKMKLFKNFERDDTAILNKDNTIIMKNLPGINGIKRFFSMKTAADIYIDGDSVKHNGNVLFNREDIYVDADVFVQDAMAATLAALNLNISYEDIREGLKEFKGIPHRMEYIGNYGGIDFINNSMCTNPGAFSETIKDFPHSVLIVGGRLKGINPEQVIGAIIKYADGVVIIGESKKILSEMLEKNGYHNFILADSMKDAVRNGIRMSPSRIILHPGGASQDMYKDFTERGEAFKQAVRRYYER